MDNQTSDSVGRELAAVHGVRYDGYQPEVIRGDAVIGGFMCFTDPDSRGSFCAFTASQFEMRLNSLRRDFACAAQ